jgi:hypothetical protein
LESRRISLVGVDLEAAAEAVEAAMFATRRDNKGAEGWAMVSSTEAAIKVEVSLVTSASFGGGGIL